MLVIMVSMGSVLARADKLDHPVHYTAQDSVVLMGNGRGYLHGASVVTYEDMELDAEYIEAVMDSSELNAMGVYHEDVDSVVGRPVFKDKSDEYRSHEMHYNIKTKKAFIRHVVTTQGEGHIVADKTKKQQDDVMAMKNGRYSTCSDTDNPHFYLALTKAKVKPKHYIASGPAYLVVGDVPLPLAIPFGFFPFTDQYSSGLIMPQLGDDYTRGLYAQGIGYYFALCDYADLTVTGDIYTRGTWAINASSKYIWRYHFSGNININYRVDKVSDHDLPGYGLNKNFNIQWTHTQDSKSNPYCTFSASVNFSTSGYNRSNINSYYNTSNSENTKSSSISYTQRFPDSPWSLTATLGLNQRSKDSTLSLTLPDLTVNMSSISPFKRKKAVGKERWYEKIKMSYSANAKIATKSGGIKENQFIHSDFLKDWQSGIRQSANINASFAVAKYLNITPTISMTNRTYFTRLEQSWDTVNNRVHTDTTKGFYNVFDFTVGLSMSTKIYAFLIPSRKLFPKSTVDRFRMVFTPTVGANFRPDFGKRGWGYYGHYVDSAGVDHRYSRYSNGIYGTAGTGLTANVTFGLAANVEVKHINRSDTTGKNPWMVSSIIDNFSVNGGYNFAADSMNWSNFSVNLRIKLPKVLDNYTVNLNTSLDPYMYEFDAHGYARRTNKQYWHHGKFPHWSGVSTSLSYTLSNEVISKWFGKKKSRGRNQASGDGNQESVGGNQELKEMGSSEPDDGFQKTEIPWSLTFNYSIRYGEDGGGFDTAHMYPHMGITQNLSLSGNIGLGKGWKISATTSYDFKAKQFSYTNFSVTRDLHCWSMSATFVPFGIYKSYTFHIGVNAGMLADLKYDKTSANSTSKQITWW